MGKTTALLAFFLLAAAPRAGTAQGGPPKIVDAHLHHNGDPAFLENLATKLDSVDGVAFLLTPPKFLEQVRAFIAQPPRRLVGFGDISLDDPQAPRVLGDEGPDLLQKFR